ncbi:hypothetical protein BG005_009303, partial [Podila minutissima]
KSPPQATAASSCTRSKAKGGVNTEAKKRPHMSKSTAATSRPTTQPRQAKPHKRKIIEGNDEDE